MELKPGYKQTEVGVIPEDWVTKKLGEAALLKARIGWQGLTTAEYLEQGDYFLITGTDFKSGFIDWDNCVYVDFIRYKQDRFIQVKENDVLVTKDGTIGKIAFIKKVPKPATLNSGVFVIRPIEENFHPEFLYYVLLSDIFTKFLLQLSAGSTINHLYQKDFVHFIFPVPETIDEQTAIANALSDADALIQSLTRLIAKKRQIKQGAMQTLLNPYENGRLKAGWVMKSILELADNKKELFDDGDWIESEHITSKGIRLIQTGNIGVGQYVEKEAKKYIYETSFEKLHCKHLRKGDLLICRLAEPAGRACVLPDIGETKIVTSVDVTIFRPRKDVANRIYLANLFTTPDWFKKVNESVGGTTHKRISRGSLGK